MQLARRAATVPQGLAKSFGIRIYARNESKSFRMRIYEKLGGWGAK
jgi:hypothetical protein